MAKENGKDPRMPTSVQNVADQERQVQGHSLESRPPDGRTEESSNGWHNGEGGVKFAEEDTRGQNSDG